MLSRPDPLSLYERVWLCQPTHWLWAPPLMLSGWTVLLHAVRMNCIVACSRESRQVANTATSSANCVSVINLLLLWTCSSLDFTVRSPTNHLPCLYLTDTLANGHLDLQQATTALKYKLKSIGARVRKGATLPVPWPSSAIFQFASFAAVSRYKLIQLPLSR